MTLRGSSRKHAKVGGAASGRPRWYARGVQLSPRATALLGLVVFAVSLGLFLFRYLVPVPVGASNQGDGYRATCTLGLIPETHGFPRFYSFLLAELNPDPVQCTNTVEAYWTSQTLLLDLGRPLTHLLGLKGEVNLLAVGLICCLIASVAIAAMAMALRVSLAARVAIAALVWLIVADAAYFDYFASPVGEAVGVLGILLICAGIPLLGRGFMAGFPALVMIGGGGMLAVGSKTQLLVLTVPVMAILLLRTVRIGNLRGRVARLLAPRVLGAVAALGVITVGALSYQSQQTHDRYIRMNPVDTIFSGIVDGKHDTAGDLEFLGLPQEWSKYAGYHFWSHRQKISRDPRYQEFQDQLTLGNVAQYWLHHPGRALEVAQLRGQQLLGLRPDYLGSYAPSAHKQPKEQEHRVTFFTTAAQSVKGAGLFLLVPLWAGSTWIGLRALRRGLRRGGTHLDRSLGTMLLFLVTAAVSQYLIAAFAEAIENEKHMVFASFSTLMLLPVLLTVFCAGRIRRQQPALAVPSQTRVLPRPSAASNIPENSWS
ncbi:MULTISPECIES: glycan biosynthesis hexose transferase WsfD [Streptomyces]|uniref:glycan biosynthesis hexose transferase WsfD n=1 Tax=Streptomyces TaxID=1883 RepID=UPI001415B7C1|nr:hypothetical protein [Streptomyces sp. SID7805]MYU57333.1 hypothetical protein [Streptomyces sp. SID7805]